MKIIAGKYKNRLIPTIKSSDYRPSTSMIKEAIFSILSSGDFADKPLEGANILDLFSGSGALSFEGMSRGAKFSTLIDVNPEYLKLAESLSVKMGINHEMEFICSRASLIWPAKRQYDIVFIDPPYRKKLILPAMNAIIKNNYLTDQAIIVIEAEKEYRKEELASYISFLKDKIYGSTRLIIGKYHNEQI